MGREPIAKAAKTLGPPVPAPPGRSERPAPPGRRLMAEAPPLMTNHGAGESVGAKPCSSWIFAEKCPAVEKETLGFIHSA